MNDVKSGEWRERVVRVYSDEDGDEDDKEVV